MADFYEAQLGGVRLYLASADTDAGRTLVEHRPTRGDQVEVDDRGQGPHRTRVDLLFVTMAGAPPPLDRLRKLVALVAAGNPDGFFFSHPVEGTYRVAIGDFSHSLGTSGQLRASASLVRMEAPTAAVTPIGPGVSPDAGLEAVTASAGAVADELADADLESDVPAAVVASVGRWAEVDTAVRTVFMEAASISQQIQDEMARLELAADLRLWPAYKAMVTLAASVQAAAEAATAEVATVFRLRVSAATALRALVARVYGSRLAAERLAQVIKLNDAGNPARIPAGTELIMPALAPAPRSG